MCFIVPQCVKGEKALLTLQLKTKKECRAMIKTKEILLVVLLFLSLALFETQKAQAGTSSSKIRDFQGISPPENDRLLETEQLAYKRMLLKQR